MYWTDGWTDRRKNRHMNRWMTAEILTPPGNLESAAGDPGKVEQSSEDGRVGCQALDDCLSLLPG